MWIKGLFQKSIGLVFLVSTFVVNPLVGSSEHGQVSDVVYRVSPRPYPTENLWVDATGGPLPFQSDEEILDFLSTAKVVSRKRVGVGINGIYKVRLEKGGLQVHAAFRDMRLEKARTDMADGTFRTNFRDDCFFELAAYRLSRLLGLRNVPPVVTRKIDGKRGTLQIWVEDTIMEKERQENKMEAPDPMPWTYQLHIMRLFDNLIYNEDRNLGNILIDARWKLWMIDHTRSFRLFDTPPSLHTIQYCDRYVFEQLKSLKDTVIRAEMKGLLSGPELKNLLRRRQRLVAHIERLIAQRGEHAVLF